VARLLEAGGIGLADVRITRLAEHTFYASITVDGANGPVQVDARPSDALTLALLTTTPVSVALDVLHAVDAQHREQRFPTADEVRAQAQQHADAITNNALAEWERLRAQLREECT
jgi:bifunctional DNase/RNase